MSCEHRSRWSHWFRKPRPSGRAARRLAFDSLEERRLLTAGSLDPTFGTGGVASTSFPYAAPSSDTGKLVVVQPDGKIIVGSETQVTPSSGSSSFVLTRYAANGSIDTSFGNDGTVTVGFGATGTATFTGMALTPQGQIVVVGDVDGSTTNGANEFEFALARYDADGSLDTTFNGTGYVLTAVNDFSEAEAVAVQPDGKIVVAGTAFSDPFVTPNGDNDFAVVRYDVDGSLDSSFGTGGIAYATVTTNTVFTANPNSVALTAGGEIVVGGTAVPAPTGDQGGYVLTRLTASGSVDTSFGTNGVVISDVGSPPQDDFMAVQSDGKVIVGGTTTSYASNVVTDSFVLGRYNADGTVDSSFGTDGVVPTNVSLLSNQLAGLTIQSDGKIVAVGTASVPVVISPIVFTADAVSGAQASASTAPSQQFVVARYNTDGSLDSGFGSGGEVLTDAGGGNSGANAVAVSPTGDIVAVGVADNGPNPEVRATAVVAYTSSGALDTTFNLTGIELQHVSTSIQPGDGSVAALVTQPNGDIIAVGNATTGPSPLNELTLTRYNPNGTLDTSFGSGGIVAGLVDGMNFIASAAALEPDGQIVVVGSAGYNFAVVRFDSNGSLDTSFGNQGLAVTTLTIYGGNATSVAIQADGKIVASGEETVSLPGEWVFDPAQTNALVVRYNTDGTLDTTFNRTGTIVGESGYAQVAIQADGKIDVLNTTLQRFNADGSVDTTFGNDGVVSVSGTELAIQPDGKTLIVSINNGETELERYNADGTLDMTFNEGAPVPLAPLSYVAVGGIGPPTLLAVEPDGQIVVAGENYGNTFVEAFNSSGSEDLSFGRNGNANALPFSANALGIDGAGNIVVAGGTSAFQVARLEDAPPNPVTPPGTLTLHATGNDQLSVVLYSTTEFGIVLDGLNMIYQTTQYNAVDFTGATGTTAVVSDYVSTAGVVFSANSLAISSQFLQVNLINTATIYVYGNSSETAQLNGGAGGNTLVVLPQYTEMYGPGFSDFAEAFGQTYGYSSGPQDTAYFYAGAQDTVVATPTYSYLTGLGAPFNEGFFGAADGFSSILAQTTAGAGDQAWLYDSPGGTNAFVANNQYSYMSGPGFFNEVTGFISVIGVSGGANDYAYLTDTAGGASFSGYATYSFLAGANFTYQAIGFANLAATGTTSDQAELYDSNPNDTVQQNGQLVTLTTANGSTILDSFGEVETHVATADDPNHEVDYFYNGLGS